MIYNFIFYFVFSNPLEGKILYIGLDNLSPKSLRLSTKAIILVQYCRRKVYN